MSILIRSFILFTFEKQILIGFSTGFDVSEDYDLVERQVQVVEEFVAENEALIVGSVSADKEAMFLFGRVLWYTLNDPSDDLSLQTYVSQIFGDDNFVRMLEYFRRTGEIL